MGIDPLLHLLTNAAEGAAISDQEEVVHPETSSDSNENLEAQESEAMSLRRWVFGKRNTKQAEGRKQ